MEAGTFIFVSTSVVAETSALGSAASWMVPTGSGVSVVFFSMDTTAGEICQGKRVLTPWAIMYDAYHINGELLMVR